MTICAISFCLENYEKWEKQQKSQISQSPSPNVSRGTKRSSTSDEDDVVKRTRRSGELTYCNHYTAVCRQNKLTLISEIVEESDFSGTAHNSAYVSDVQSLISKSTSTLRHFLGKII